MHNTDGDCHGYQQARRQGQHPLAAAVTHYNPHPTAGDIPAIHIRRITPQDTVELRHTVLWPDKPVSYVLLPEDDANAAQAYKAFLKHYPQYTLTWTLDALRRSDFARLDRSGETYVDYMGGSLYPESLIRVHTGFLQRNILGNTHSINAA